MNTMTWITHNPHVGQFWNYNNRHVNYDVKIVNIDKEANIASGLVTHIYLTNSSSFLYLGRIFTTSIMTKDSYDEHMCWTQIKASSQNIYDRLKEMLLS